MNPYFMPGLLGILWGVGLAMALNAEPDDGYPLSQVERANSFIAARLDQADPHAYRRYQLEAIKEVYPDDGIRLPEDYRP